MEIMTKEKLNEYEKLFEERKQAILNAKDEYEITGTTYYVSIDGDDDNDGLTPETAWKTAERVNRMWLKPGDGVLFKRGDLFRGYKFMAQAGVTYGAYGEGEKPKFYGWTENLADASLWEEYDKEKHIWKYKKLTPDTGTIVFNDGEKVSRKLIPSYKNLQFVCREDETKPFVMRDEMTEDLDLFWYFEETLTRKPSKGEDFPVPDLRSEAYGEVYVRCDKGNPGAVFNSIELIPKGTAIQCKVNRDVTIKNLCIKYYCFGITGKDTITNLKITNCEIGWIGGNIMMYLGTDPNYPQGGRGSVTRYGNAIEIYGGCVNFTASDNYIYQVYDAGITHQVNTTTKRVMTGIRYTGNVLEKCVYAIEYFLDQINGESESYMDDIVMSDNFIRLSGYGWGQQRHNYYEPAHIKGWSYVNTASNYAIRNNIFDRASYRMLHLVAKKDEYCPEMDGNTYIQYNGQMIGQWGGNEIKEPEIEIFDEKAEEKINNIFGDKTAKVYVIK